MRGAGEVHSLEYPAYDAHYNGTKLPDDMASGPLVVIKSFNSSALGLFDDSGQADIYLSNVPSPVVEINIATGLVAVLDYAVSDDIGPIINHMLVEDQSQGGSIQRIGMALSENLQNDFAGQLANKTMEAYQLPLITETPPITKIYQANTVSDQVPLGTKGVGESGGTTSPAAVLKRSTTRLSASILTNRRPTFHSRL